jgi:hypothetical protein
MPRLRRLAAFLAIAASTPLAAQVNAPPAGPLALLLPASARPAALGNAWVAGRDEYSVFYNPATAGTTAWANATYGGYGSQAFSLSTVAGAVFGPTTMAWGAHYVNFSVPRSYATYPYVPADLARTGEADNSSLVALVAARIVYKGFNVGAALKYAQDVAPQETSASSLLRLPARGSATLLDLGTSHALWTGVAGLALQNIAEPYTLGNREVEVPTQLALGWTKLRTLGVFDFGFAGQATLRRHGWVGVGGGVDLGYGWIEGITVGVRLGARRTETEDEEPLTLGATVNVDRFSVEYGLGSFSGGNSAHRFTMRVR